jgi:hypothetical protein
MGLLYTFLSIHFIYDVLFISRKNYFQDGAENKPLEKGPSHASYSSGVENITFQLILIE